MLTATQHGRYTHPHKAISGCACLHPLPEYIQLDPPEQRKHVNASTGGQAYGEAPQGEAPQGEDPQGEGPPAGEGQGAGALAGVPGRSWRAGPGHLSWEVRPAWRCSGSSGRGTFKKKNVPRRTLHFHVSAKPEARE